MVAYFLARDAVRPLFRPWLPLLIPIQLALIVMFGALVIAAIYAVGTALALRWVWRTLTR